MSHGLRSTRVWVTLLGWFAIVLMAPLQVSMASAGAATGSLPHATSMAGMSSHIPMSRLTDNACIQLQCHAAPTLTAVGPAMPPFARLVLVAMGSVLLLEWRAVAVQARSAASAPPWRSDPVLAVRPARLLI